MVNKVEICGVNTSKLPVLNNQEKNDITILAKGFVYEGERGGALYIEIANEGKLKIGVRAHYKNFKVNGYKIPFIGTTNNGVTAPGETNLYKISIEDRYLDSIPISKISELCVALFIDNYESDSNDHILDESDPVRIAL